MSKETNIDDLILWIEELWGLAANCPQYELDDAILTDISIRDEAIIIAVVSFCWGIIGNLREESDSGSLDEEICKLTDEERNSLFYQSVKKVCEIFSAKKESDWQHYKVFIRALKQYFSFQTPLISYRN